MSQNSILRHNIACCRAHPLGWAVARKSAGYVNQMASMFQTCRNKISLLIVATAFAGLAGAGPALADKIKHPRAIFSGLDKITGRIISFEVAIEETVQFGSLQITPRVCYTRPATEAPQTTSFIEVDEIDANSQYTRIFNGWVYAASPGLNGIEHPVYDIWLNDCKGGTSADLIVSAPEAAEAAPDPAFADAAAKPPKPGTVPKPRQPKIPAGPPQIAPVAVVPAPERRQPTQSFFPTTILPLGGGVRPDSQNSR